MIGLRSCPRCGVPAKSSDKFCGRCGAPLGPDSGDAGPDVTKQPEGRLAGTTPRWSSRNIITAVACIIIVLVIVAAGYPLISGKGLFATGSTAGIPGTGDQPASQQNVSYVVIMNEEPQTASTPAPTTVIITSHATTMIATIPTTPEDIICAADRLECNETCVDAKSDSRNCGRCNVVCPSGETCVNGNCMIACSSGKTSCPDGCFDLLTDPKHCSSCINSCPGGLTCSDGECVPPATRMRVIE